MLLYNLLPDMVGRLSSSNVEEGKFRRVIKYIFSFIDKAKQTGIKSICNVKYLV